MVRVVESQLKNLYFSAQFHFLISPKGYYSTVPRWSNEVITPFDPQSTVLSLGSDDNGNELASIEPMIGNSQIIIFTNVNG